MPAKLVYDPCLGSLGTFRFPRILGTGRPRWCLCSPGNLRSHRMQCTCAVRGVPSDSPFLVASEKLLLLCFEVGDNSGRTGVAHLNRMATNLTVLSIRLASHRCVKHHGNHFPAIGTRKEVLHRFRLHAGAYTFEVCFIVLALCSHSCIGAGCYTPGETVPRGLTFNLPGHNAKLNAAY
jgi:hypothetical protein